MKFREHHLFSILQSFELQKLPLDVFLRNYFRQNKAIGAKDRRHIAEAIYGMIRWRGLLDHLVDKPSWETRYACYQQINPLNFLKREDIPSHVRVSFPKAFFHKILESYGEEKALSLCQISNTPAPTTVRANLLKISREELMKRWQEHYSISATVKSPWGIVFHRKINFFDTAEFREGFFEIQDEGSQLLAHLVEAKPKDQVLDYCAGSGGKSLAFAPKMEQKGVIYLHDIRPHALDESKKRLKRAGIQHAQLLYPDDTKGKLKLKGKMDWVLVDAPCSGTGTLRRNPDMKWKFDPRQIENLLEEQKTIFKEALEYLKPTGHIVYATCSLLPEENEQQVEYFKKTFHLELARPLFSTLPEQGGMDGFFGAVLKKI